VARCRRAANGGILIGLEGGGQGVSERLPNGTIERENERENGDRPEWR
jgi:hypothetical protein